MCNFPLDVCGSMSGEGWGNNDGEWGDGCTLESAGKGLCRVFCRGDSRIARGDAISKIAETVFCAAARVLTLTLRGIFALPYGGLLHFRKVRKCFTLTLVHKELMPLLMNPAPRGKIGRDKDNLIKTSATRPPSFFETPLVRHLTSHSLPLGSPSLARCVYRKR